MVLNILFVVVTRRDDNGYIRVLPGKLLQNLKSIHSRHDEIKDHCDRPMFPELSQPFLTIRSSIHANSGEGVFNDGSNEQVDRFLIVNN